MSNETNKIIRKRVLLLLCSIILVLLLFIVFFVDTIEPVKAMYFIYIIQPVLVALLVHILISNCVFFSALLKNKTTIKEYGDVKKAYNKTQITLIVIKRVLCIALVSCTLIGRYFGLLNVYKGNYNKTELEEPITQFCNSEINISNEQNLEDGFLFFNCGCIKNLKKYSYNDSYAHKNIVFIKGVPYWYIKKYSKEEIHYMSLGTKWYNHSTYIKTTEKNGVQILYTIDDDLTNMELIAFDKHTCVKISIGGPSGSELMVDENKIIEYAYEFLQ